MNSKYIAAPDDRILITGANGFIGARVVEILLAYGFVNLRYFVRPSSRLERLETVLQKFPAGNKPEMVAGDLLSREDCRKAAEGVSIIYHLAAGFDKSFDEVFKNSVLATRNLLDAFIQHGRPKRFVVVSSFAVYSNFGLERGALLDETCPLETAPQERADAYGFGKLKQEELVTEYGRNHKLPYVILRPGAVFGPGKKDLSGRIGVNALGLFMHVGGSNILPLTFVDNCAEAIVLGGLVPNIDGEVINVVDDEVLTSRQFLRAYRRHCGRLFSVPVPYYAAYWLCAMCECCAKRIKQMPRSYNRRRCAAEWKGNRYANQKLHEKLGWKPRVNMNDAMAAFLAQFGSETV